MCLEDERVGVASRGLSVKAASRGREACLHVQICPECDDHEDAFQAF